MLSVHDFVHSLFSRLSSYDLFARVVGHCKGEACCNCLSFWNNPMVSQPEKDGSSILGSPCCKNKRPYFRGSTCLKLGKFRTNMVCLVAQLSKQSVFVIEERHPSLGSDEESPSIGVQPWGGPTNGWIVVELASCHIQETRRVQGAGVRFVLLV